MSFLFPFSASKFLDGYVLSIMGWNDTEQELLEKIEFVLWVGGLGILGRRIQRNSCQYIIEKASLQI